MFSWQHGYVKLVGKERAERLGAVRRLGAVMPITAVGAVEAVTPITPVGAKGDMRDKGMAD